MAKRRYPRFLHVRFFDYARGLPVRGPVIHWPPQWHGPSTYLFQVAHRCKNQRQDAIEWLSTFMSPRQAARRYDKNERGEVI